jgi:4-amino-4-deoxychorismate lyase
METLTPRVLQAEEVIEHLRALRTRQPVPYWAFYSSQLGGIVTDPALMVLPFDDHIVHRGHGVFDTAAIVDGKIYDLEAHLDRFVRSAGLSKLPLPCRREEMREIIARTAAAAASATAPFATGSPRDRGASACPPRPAPSPASS